MDPRGRLAWETNDIDGDHVVAILSERVSDEYLAFLRERGVSYVLAGARDVDLPLALESIGTRFGVRTLMLEGGGKINGAMLRAGSSTRPVCSSRRWRTDAAARRPCSTWREITGCRSGSRSKH